MQQPERRGRRLAPDDAVPATPTPSAHPSARPSQPAPQPSKPWWRDGRTWLLLTVTALSLAIGWEWKSACHEEEWSNGSEWRKLCYSDIQALYGTRGAGDGTWPYLETANEYPPLTGLYMHLAGELSHGKQDYLAVSAAGLALLALATTVVLGELLGRDRRVLYWAVAPALAAYAFYNWDLLAVAPTLGAVLAYRKRRYGLAGLLLGLGAAAKLYPAFLAPALGVRILRREDGLGRGGWRFGLGFAAAWLAAHLPFLLLDAHGIAAAYTFQAGREPNYESLWYSAAHIGRLFGWPALAAFNREAVYAWGSLLPFALAVAVSGWASFTRRLDPVAAALIPLFAFLAFNKVQSLQYALWAIPLMAVVPLPRSLKAMAVVADLAVLLTLGHYFALQSATSDPQLFLPAAVAALLRAGVWTACAAWLVREALRGEATPADAPATHPAPAQEAAA